MKAFLCLALLVACSVAAPAPEEAQRDKRSYISDLGYYGSGLGYGAGLGYGHGLGYGLGYGSLGYGSLGYGSLGYGYGGYYGAPIVTSVAAPVVVKKIVTVPKVVAVKKIYSSGWW